jgi:CRISPR/Cas system-associated endonuclease Cas3-HD
MLTSGVYQTPNIKMERRAKMSTLEKTIGILNKLTESQIEIIYNYAQFINSQQITIEQKKTETVDDVLESLVGILPDTGKTLQQYREERTSDRYETAD